MAGWAQGGTEGIMDSRMAQGDGRGGTWGWQGGRGVSVLCGGHRDAFAPLQPCLQQRSHCCEGLSTAGGAQGLL